MGASKTDVKLWPDRIIPYMPFDDHPHKTDIKDAMDDIQSVTVIRFTRKRGQSNYLKFPAKATSSETAIGMPKNAGAREVSISKGFLAWHEIMHAIGLIHEQSRSDRDEYVTINWDNIESDRESDFTIAENSINLTEYDFGSVMHYNRSNTGWGSNGNGHNMTRKKGGQKMGPGKWQKVAKKDAIAINLLYGKAWKGPTTCLNGWDRLEKGGSLISPKKKYYVKMNDDGNLVLYKGLSEWVRDTRNKTHDNGMRAVLSQGDPTTCGRLQVLNKSGKVIWKSSKIQDRIISVSLTLGDNGKLYFKGRYNPLKSHQRDQPFSGSIEFLK